MSIKALVVDHDRAARAAVKRLLSHVNVDVVEAENGLVALSMLESADPDFVVLEIDLPILSGLDCLSAIRQSPQRSDIPVVCITAAGTRDHVDQMVALGVADFILKPINPVDVLPRVKNLLVRVAQWRHRVSSGAIDVLLMVDHDPNFLSFAKPLLETSFEVLESHSSTHAAMLYRDADVKPTVVCLAEGLPVMSEDLTIDVIRRVAVETGSHPPKFILMSRSGEVAADKAARYGGILRKCFVPQDFIDEFRRVVLREKSPVNRLRVLVREGLRDEVVTATQQTIGVMVGSEITDLGPSSEAAIPEGAQAAVLLEDAGAGLALAVRIVSGRQEVEAIGSLIAGHPVTFDEGGSEVLGELANTIAGRLRANLLARGFDLQMGLPEVQADSGAERPESDLSASFRCAGGEIFTVRLEVRQGRPAGIEEPPPTAARVPEGGEGVAAGAVAAAADDVLF